MGDLTVRRDFCDVRDVVRAYRLLAEHGVSGDAYNIASNHDVSIQEIANELVAAIAPHVRLVRDDQLLRPAEIEVLRGSYEKLRALTGWEPTIPLDQSLRDVVSRYAPSTVDALEINARSPFSRAQQVLAMRNEPTSLEGLMESRAPAVVAVVVTTGPGPGLEVAVASLAAQNYEELSLLVVANGESEHVSTRVAAVAPSAYVRILEENRGFAAACNEAALMVEGSAFFLFCHDDVRLEPDALQLMVEAAFRANAGIVTPKFVNYDDPMVLLHVGQTCDRFGVVHERIELGEIDHGQQDLERDVFVAPGGVTLVRSDLFATLRGFDPIIPVLGEDLDLSWRAQIAGSAHRGRSLGEGGAPRDDRGWTATGDRPRARAARVDRTCSVDTNCSSWPPDGAVAPTFSTLLWLFVMDTMEFALSIVGRDRDRAGAILGSWRWLFRNRRRIRERRRQRHEIQVLSDDELLRLQVGGASRLKRFFLILVRDGLDRARGHPARGRRAH